MKSRYSGLLISFVGVIITVLLAVNLAAADKPAKVMSVQGKVQMLDKSGSTITVDVKGVKRTVAYNAETKFLYGHSKSNKPGSVDQVKEGNYISCSGAYDKMQLKAAECIYRETK